MTPTVAQPARGERPRGDRGVALLTAAAVLVGLVVGAVLLFGVDRPPALDSVADAPEPAPPASIAWVGRSGNEACLSVVRPSGEVVELWCDQAAGEVEAWTSPGEIEVHTYQGRGEATATIDARTGRVLDRSSGGGFDGAAEHDRQVVWTEHRDGELIVHLQDDETVLWRTPAPDRYRVESSALSPDGEWVAMVDVSERLLVVPADGAAPPRVWATDVPPWDAVVWEGTDRSSRG